MYSLETDELDHKLDQILERNDKFHEILVKTDSCLYSPKQPESEFSSLSIHPSNKISNNVVIKLPKLELFKFNGDIRMWQTFWEFNSSIHSKGPGTRIHFFEIFSKFKYFGNILSMLHEE